MKERELILILMSMFFMFLIIYSSNNQMSFGLFIVSILVYVYIKGLNIILPKLREKIVS